MDPTNRKIMTFSFVISGFLIALTIQVLFESLAVTFSPVARLENIEVARHGIPLVSGLLGFMALQFNPMIRKWADECIIEIRKVIWPSKKDTTSMTTVCCVMVLISAAGLGIFDLISSNLVQIFLKLKF